MKQILGKIGLLGTLLIMGGCASEPNYRGVPSPKWMELTAEQKQLIVDNAYEGDIK